MYSQCPDCLTRFRVTAAALRAAHGTVRCGRCGSAFDALPHLTDTLTDERPAKHTPPLPAVTVPVPPGSQTRQEDDGLPADDDGAVITEFHFTADDIEQVFVDARDWPRRSKVPPAAEDAPGAPVSTPDSRVHAARQPTEPGDVYVHEPEAVEDITLEGERIVIEGLAGLDDDLSELSALDGRADGEPAQSPDTEAPLVARDSTGFEVPHIVPDPRYPVLDADGSRRAASAVSPPQADVMPVRPEVVEAMASNADPLDAPRTEGSAVVVPDIAADVATPAHVPAASNVAAQASTASAAATPHEAIRPFRLRERSTAFEDALESDADGAQPGGRSALGWGLGALVLALALVAQLTHHYRQDLARDATLGPVLREVYARLGYPLAPHWDLAAYELRQWNTNDAVPAPTGVMTVRASLRNRAAFAQPLPLLRLELEDRFGGTVARRDFSARDYLKDPARAGRMLAAGEQTDVELAIVDAGADAVGYRLDVCLQDETRGVRCAQSANDTTHPR